MALTKHQTLHKRMCQLIGVLDQFYSNVESKLNIVQLHFYEKSWIIDRPDISESSFRAMVHTTYIGFKRFTMESIVRETWCSLPCFGAVICKRYYHPSEILQVTSKGPPIPWGVQFVFPKTNFDLMAVRHQQSLLYCPDNSEFPIMHRWLQDDEATNSPTYQLQTIAVYHRELHQLRENLKGNPQEAFNEAVAKWKADPDCPDTIERNFDVSLHQYAPPPGQNVALAWEGVKKAIRQREHRDIRQFLQIYRDILQEYMFRNIPWDQCAKADWLRQWEDQLFRKKRSGTKSRPGRWPQGHVVDTITAARFIRYFVDKFIRNSKDIKSAETACILWILLWCDHHRRDDISQEDLFKISTDHILTKNRVKIGQRPVKLSKGLHKLLLCLIGNGKGDRNRALFAKVKSPKALERQLLEASHAILGDDALPVLPSAFFNFPHAWPEIRVSSVERQAMRNARHLVATGPDEAQLAAIENALLGGNDRPPSTP